LTTDYLLDKDFAEPEFNLFDFVKPNTLQQVLLKPDPLTLHTIIGQILHALAGELTPADTDSRIRLIEKAIDNGEPDDLTPTALAALVHLSESRLRSLFRHDTGVPLYKYILWRRIRFAISRIMAGHPINDAARSAGFTDNSHFHKILVNMFGISPSQFLRDNKTMEILTCDRSPLNFVTVVYNTAGDHLPLTST
jgi:AraC-like DNA-binding protein